MFETRCRWRTLLQRLSWSLCAISVILLLNNAPSAQTQTLVVNSLTDTDDGACDEAPDCTLREAINIANGTVGPDLITFAVTGVIATNGLPALTDDGTAIGASAVCGTDPLGTKAAGTELRGPKTDESIGFHLRNTSKSRSSGFANWLWA